MNINNKKILLLLSIFFTFSNVKIQGQNAKKQPNILFIPVDDLNHWVEYLKVNPQVKTPNLDRLVKQGVSFTNAYSAGASCNPSRTALMSGKRPSTSGCYKNAEHWQDYVKEGTALNHVLKKNGYDTYATGKIYHNITGDYKSGWNEDIRPEVPNPSTPEVNWNPKKKKDQGYYKPVEISLKDTDIPDWYMVDYCEKILNKKHDKPFFLACGFVKPHLPWIVPQKYYDMFPLEDIQLPPHLKNDLDDVPTMGRRIGFGEKEHKKIVGNNMWETAVQSYLATIAYMDMNLGRLLDVVEKSEYADDLQIVLFGDHGWHLGEKEHWRKFTLWNQGTHTPLIWVAPGISKKNKTCDAPVDLMSLFPTICELTNIEKPSYVEGVSVVPLLKNPKKKWEHVAISTHGFKNHAIRTKEWRYIRYKDGSEELYDEINDPNEYKNLASNPKMQSIIKKLKQHLPKINKEGIKRGSKK